MTSPDVNDGHQHSVELDDAGDGMTSPAGSYPHVHEVVQGVVQDFVYGRFSSSHDGRLSPIQVDPSDSMAGADDPRMQADPRAQNNPDMQKESIREALFRAYRGENPDILAENLLFG